MKRIGLLAGVLSLWMTATAGYADGLLSAVSFRPLSQGSAILVRPLDNSDHNMALKKDFERALRRKGYTVSEDATLILSFETLDSGGSWTGGGPNRFVELSNNHDQSGISTPRVRFNLFDSTRGGILNSKRRDKTRTVTPSRFRIDVTVDDKTNGKRLWQGWGSADIGLGNNRDMTRALIPIMVEDLGKTVQQKSFPLQ